MRLSSSASPVRVSVIIRLNSAGATLLLVAVLVASPLSGTCGASPYDPSTIDRGYTPISPDTSGRASGSGLCEQMKCFAAELESEGEYYRAITEYMRWEFQCPEQAAPAVDLAIARCLYREGAYGDLPVWAERTGGGQDDRTRARVRFLSGVGQYVSGDFTGASHSFLASMHESPEGSLRDLCVLNRSASLARDGSVSLAMGVLEGLPSDSGITEAARDLRKHLATAMAAPRKSGTVATVFSLLPGGGYAYSGHWRTAGTTLAIVSLFAWGFTEAVHDDSPSTATLLGFLTLTWYSGSIHGSRQAAERYNQAQIDRALEPVHVSCPEWVLTDDTGNR